MEYRWYIVQVLSGHEEKVSRAISEISARQGVSEDFQEIFIPYEEVVSLKRHKKHVGKHKLFPGYVFVRMRMCDKSMSLIKGISGVSGFLSESSTPEVIMDSQIESMKKQILQSSATDKIVAFFEIGDDVKINGGPFQYLHGKIDSINEDKGVAKVLITMFGRTTKVELELSHIERLEEGGE